MINYAIADQPKRENGYRIVNFHREHQFTIQEAVVQLAFIHGKHEISIVGPFLKSRR